MYLSQWNCEELYWTEEELEELEKEKKEKESRINPFEDNDLPF